VYSSFIRATARVVSCIVAGTLALSSFASAADDVPNRANPNGLALLYDIGRFHHRAVVEGDLELPKVDGNHFFYCVWFMLIDGQKRPTGIAPFVQGGLMRWDRDHFRLTPFNTIQRPNDRELTYGAFPPLPRDSPYHVRLVAENGRVTIDVGDVRVLDVPERDYFLPDAKRYVQIGAETSVYGDRESGILRNVTIQGDDDPVPRPFAATCRYIGRGITIEDGHGTFVASGVLARTGTARFHGAGCGYAQ
jgi:hypothetical protein